MDGQGNLLISLNCQKQEYCDYGGMRKGGAKPLEVRLQNCERTMNSNIDKAFSADQMKQRLFGRRWRIDFSSLFSVSVPVVVSGIPKR